MGGRGAFTTGRNRVRLLVSSGERLLALMGETVIQVENLSTRYVLSHQDNGKGYKTFREALTGGAKSLLKPLTHSPLPTPVRLRLRR
jgi:hypothetical protein